MGEISPVPHQKSVFLRLITDTLAVHDQLGVTVRVGRFQIFRPFILVRVDGEVQLDLVLFVFQVVVRIGDDGHNQLFIQKRREFFTLGVFSVI